MRSREICPRSLAVAALLCLVAVTASAQQAVDYRVSFPAPEHHYAQVEVTWSAVQSATLEARLEMGETVIVNIRAFVDGAQPPHRVLPESRNKLARS